LVSDEASLCEMWYVNTDNGHMMVTGDLIFHFW